MAELVGHISQLFRYPVKSMLGEEPSTLHLGELGVTGDRSFALWDKATERVASAKNPRRWKSLLAFRAEYVQEPSEGAPLPDLKISSPLLSDAEALFGSDESLDRRLSEVLGREVALIDSSPEDARLDQYWPEVKERDFHNHEVIDMPILKGTFFDATPVHVMTTSTLDELQHRVPESNFSVERFRPNFLIATEPGITGFVEDDWTGGILRIGDTAQLRIDAPCPRCVVTTLAQGDLDDDLEVLRATVQHNKVNAGLRTSVLMTGEARVGEPVYLVRP